MRFLLSVILTWGIGLSIPLILRFVIIRKPVSKLIAFIIAIIVLIINMFIFVSAEHYGITEDTSIAPIGLIAIASFFIVKFSFNEKD